MTGAGAEKKKERNKRKECMLTGAGGDAAPTAPGSMCKVCVTYV